MLSGVVNIFLRVSFALILFLRVALNELITGLRNFDKRPFAFLIGGEGCCGLEIDGRVLNFENKVKTRNTA